MINSIDQATDYSNRELYQYLSGINLPEFVKSASIDDTKGGDAYADVMGRHFPIGSALKTYVSAAHFVNKVGELAKLRGERYTEKIADSLDKAASIFGIKDEISELVKVAVWNNDADYQKKHVVIKIAQDEIDLFQIKTASDLTAHATTFSNSINKYPFEWRRNIAEQFVKAAEELEVDELPATVLKYAGQYFPNIVDVKEELKRRMTKVSATDRQRYQDLIEDVSHIDSKEEVFKLAECCYFMEKNAGLYNKYHSRMILGDVVDKFFTMHLDKVAEAINVVHMGGEKFAAADLESVPSDIYHEAFGFSLDPKSAEAKDILPTMPKADVSLFMELSGVRPI